jgi:hypothetical protein
MMLPGTLCGGGAAPYNGWNRFDATSGSGEYYYYQATEESMAEWWVSINVQGDPPGFLSGSQTATFPTDQDTQTFNPSQITWGLWRLFGINSSFRLSVTDWPTQTISSGYFGQGEVQVPPSVWWTRLVVCDDDGTSIGIPSSNLVVYAAAQAMTEPEEMTAMMRSVQR